MVEADPAAGMSIMRLRDEVRRAKEALSNDTDTTIAVALPGLHTDVRLTRDELEAMIRIHPDHWLWTHKRWRTRPLGEPELY